MAIDKLGMYNLALLRLGEPALATLTDDRDARYALDAAYDLDAIQYCLERIKPKFATKTVALTGAATPTLTLAYTHTLPADFITIVGVYSDTELDQPVSRYIQDGSTLLCDYGTVYLRYVCADTAVANFTPGFARVVALYLAREASYKLDPHRYEAIDAELQSVAEEVIAVESAKEPESRVSTAGSALSAAWLAIYNDALLILGQDKLPSGTADSPNRTRLDTTLEAGVVEDVLEDTEWKFGVKSVEITYDLSVDPPWGWDYALQKPADLLRISGLFSDEMMRHGIKDYVDEGDYFYCGYDTIYLRYISSDWVSSAAAWPTYFARLVAAKMAYNAAPVIAPALIEHARNVYFQRKDAGMGNDAVQSPPQVIQQGDWVTSRYRGGYRGRP